MDHSLFESKDVVVIQEINKLDSVKSQDSYSMDFHTENNQSKALTRPKASLNAKQETTSRDDNEFSDVPSQTSRTK